MTARIIVTQILKDWGKVYYSKYKTDYFPNNQSSFEEAPLFNEIIIHKDMAWTTKNGQKWSNWSEFDAQKASCKFTEMAQWLQTCIKPGIVINITKMLFPI